MITVIASIYLKENQRSKFIEIFKANIPNVLAEKGCIEYMPTVDVPTGLPIQESDKNVVTIVEKWDCLEALQAHFTASHMIAYKKEVDALVEKLSLKVLEEV